MEQANNSIEKNKSSITVVENLPNYDNDPSLIRALERAREIMKETPLPDFLLKRLEMSAED